MESRLFDKVRVLALDEMIAEGDKVAARFSMKGTHHGTFFGVRAKGKKIQVNAMNFYRVSEGQIVEEHGQPDLLGLLQQNGRRTYVKLLCTEWFKMWLKPLWTVIGPDKQWKVGISSGN